MAAHPPIRVCRPRERGGGRLRASSRLQPAALQIARVGAQLRSTDVIYASPSWCPSPSPWNRTPMPRRRPGRPFRFVSSIRLVAGCRVPMPLVSGDGDGDGYLPHILSISTVALQVLLWSWRMNSLAICNTSVGSLPGSLSLPTSFTILEKQPTTLDSSKAKSKTCSYERSISTDLPTTTATDVPTAVFPPTRTAHTSRPRPHRLPPPSLSLSSKFSLLLITNRHSPACMPVRVRYTPRGVPVPIGYDPRVPAPPLPRLFLFQVCDVGTWQAGSAGADADATSTHNP
ncbi:hypothetical protein C8Q78DRAFT_414385 [Trametes maxima]|nr:hypothetical protein C8Q78DRAFT_414385 [Trametes maxima]